MSVIALLSFIGIMLGVAALIIVMSVMNGFREELLKSILGFNGHIGISSQSPKGIPHYDPLVQHIQSLESIQSVTPLVQRQAMLSAHNIAAGALVHGITKQDLVDRIVISSNMRFGSLDHFRAGEPTIVIGRRLAEQFGLFVDDRITLTSPEGNSTAFGSIPRMRAFRVVGIFEVGMRDFDAGVVFIPLDQAQSFFNYKETINGFEVFVKEPKHVHKTTRQLEQLYPQLRILDWQQANNQFVSSLNVERNVMFIILTLIILVASLNIISSLIMLVKDKTQDIAILRTMGATRGNIMSIFFLTGSMIGVLGTFVGAVLGLVFSLNIESIRQFIESFTGANLFNAEVYFLSQLPAKVDSFEVLLVVFMALVLVFLSSIVPAWRASRLDPVESLRYE